MNIEKLYQDVWTHVFAVTWCSAATNNPVDKSIAARTAATEAAKRAVVAWDPQEAHAVIAAKGQG